MFSNLKLFGATEKRIVVQTRRGREIVNAIDVPPSKQQIEKFWRLVNKFKFWDVRLEPTGGYNCVGHVWASRRTGIFDELEKQIEVVFKDDGYRVIQHSAVNLRQERLCPGDLAAYWAKTTAGRSFVHVGQVVELRELAGSEHKIPWVLSKLDSTSGEVVHRYNDVSYEHDHIEFWTDRPVGKTHEK